MLLIKIISRPDTKKHPSYCHTRSIPVHYYTHTNPQCAPHCINSRTLELSHTPPPHSGTDSYGLASCEVIHDSVCKFMANYFQWFAQIRKLNAHASCPPRSHVSLDPLPQISRCILERSSKGLHPTFARRTLLRGCAWTDQGVGRLGRHRHDRHVLTCESFRRRHF